MRNDKAAAKALGQSQTAPTTEEAYLKSHARVPDLPPAPPTKPDIDKNSEFERCMRALVLHLPHSVHEDVNRIVRNEITTKQLEARVEENELGLSKLKGSSAQQALDIRRHFGNRISELTKKGEV